MARINATAKTDIFHSLSAAAASIGETNDCSVKAVAAVCGVDYLVAHEAMRKQGRKNRKGAMTWDIKQAVSSLGFVTQKIPSNEFIGRYPGNHKKLKSVTSHHPDRFNKVWADGNTYLVFTARHVLAVVNGINHDWSKGRALRATMILKVVAA
jgi:hypothetical protein